MWKGALNHLLLSYPLIECDLKICLIANYVVFLKGLQNRSDRGFVGETIFLAVKV